MLVNCWMNILKTREIPFTHSLNITNMLVDSSMVQNYYYNLNRFAFSFLDFWACNENKICLNIVLQRIHGTCFNMELNCSTKCIQRVTCSSLRGPPVAHTYYQQARRGPRPTISTGHWQPINVLVYLLSELRQLLSRAIQ